MIIYDKMKKSFILLFSLFLITGCTNNTKPIQDNTNTKQPDIYETFKDIVKEQESCGDDSELFVNMAILWNSEKDNWNTKYYLVTNGECFKIDERWNLSDEGGFGSIPTTIELWQNKNGYKLVKYKTAKDWNEYDSSTKEMFSDEAYKIRKDTKYKFINDKTVLQQAEDYFSLKIIPENENNFECSFCDKLRYYNRTPEADEKLNETNDFYFDYITEDNWKNTIYFGSDWSFEAKGSWDEWTWTRSFGQDENTVIVLNNNSKHVYDRYIITNQTENSLNTILEIIQRR